MQYTGQSILVHKKGGTVVDNLRILVNCLKCRKSLMNPDVQIDRLNAIHLFVKIGDKTGNLFLSQIYGSYNKRFDGIDDIEDAVVECSCPHCHNPLPFFERCSTCQAPVIGLGLQVGGIIKVCSRNGCKQHALEFEEIDHAFRLFQSQDDSHLA